MNKLAIFWFSLGAIGCIFIFQVEIIQVTQAVQYDYAYPDREEIKEMIYAIPPTEAFSSIQLNDTLLAQGDIIQSDTFNRKLHIITDGSIILERGVGGEP